MSRERSGHDGALLRRHGVRVTAQRLAVLRALADDHHHPVRRRCRQVVDVDCAAGRAPCLTPAHDAGFAVDGRQVVYPGRCPRCADATQRRGERST